MSKPYNETCPAEDFLDPKNFRTASDTVKNGEAQYAKGLSIGRSAVRVSIGHTAVWGYVAKDGGCVGSYEKIGYHANTADLLRGFLDSGCEVWVYRDERMGNLPETRLK